MEALAVLAPKIYLASIRKPAERAAISSPCTLTLAARRGAYWRIDVYKRQQLDNVVVSIPADAGDPATSYVQFGIQFATTEPNAVTEFTSLQPIIKADVINLMMNETQKTLQDPAARVALTKSCLGISNSVLSASANYTPANPFTAAYITNLVVQD